MDNNTNDMLLLGISILGIGLLLASYSIASYAEIQNLNKKIDFELIDNNNDMSYSDKYYKYLSIADFMDQKLTKNKDILIKNTSCIYLDYAQHNAIELYRLTRKRLDTEESQKNVAAGVVRKLYNMLDNYRTCKQTESYKSELNKILEDIQHEETRHINNEQRMRDFLRDEKKVTTQENTTPLTTTPAQNMSEETTIQNQPLQTTQQSPDTPQ